jgi:divalent metal cation (Fe/Co/Zn/Cd) transporter
MAALISDAKHSWLDALSSAGALTGLIAVAVGQRWGDPVAGLAVTLLICHVGYEVTTDISHRLLDGVDPRVITTAEHAATTVPGIHHAHARARWTGRILRIEIEAWITPALPISTADQIGHHAINAVHEAIPEARAVTITPRAMPEPT